MDIFLLRAFQSQVALQCDFAWRAATEIDCATRAERIDVKELFYAIQNFLNAAANISKAFWGAAGKLSAEREALRASVGVTDASPLRMTDMRNNFEHFDTRLDIWWHQSRRKNQFDLCLGSRSQIPSLDEIDVFRNYDPVTGILIFWGQSIALLPMVEEIARIRPLLEREMVRQAGM